MHLNAVDGRLLAHADYQAASIWAWGANEYDILPGMPWLSPDSLVSQKHSQLQKRKRLTKQVLQCMAAQNSCLSFVQTALH